MSIEITGYFKLVFLCNILLFEPKTPDWKRSLFPGSRKPCSEDKRRRKEKEACSPGSRKSCSEDKRRWKEKEVCSPGSRKHCSEDERPWKEKLVNIAFSIKTAYDDTKPIFKQEDDTTDELGRMEENMETGAGVVPCVGTGHRILLLSFALLFL